MPECERNKTLELNCATQPNDRLEVTSIIDNDKKLAVILIESSSPVSVPAIHLSKQDLDKLIEELKEIQSWMQAIAY